MAHNCLNAWDPNGDAASLTTRLNNLLAQNQVGWGEDLLLYPDFASLDALKGELEMALGCPFVNSRNHQVGPIQDATLRPDADGIASALRVHANAPPPNAHSDSLNPPGQFGWLGCVDPDPVALAKAQALLQALKDCLDQAPGGERQGGGPPPARRVPARAPARRRRKARKPAARKPARARRRAR